MIRAYVIVKRQRNPAAHAETTDIGGAMVRRAYAQRGVFEVLLPDADKLWDPILRQDLAASCTPCADLRHDGLSSRRMVLWRRFIPADNPDTNDAPMWRAQPGTKTKRSADRR